jgi:hypothetical protein
LFPRQRIALLSVLNALALTLKSLADEEFGLKT